MDSGKSISKKTISREPIEYIQKIQREMQSKLKTHGNAIHLVGRHDRVTSILIPRVLLAVTLPLSFYGLYTLATQNAPLS